MGCFAEQGRGLQIFRAVRRETDPRKARQLIAGALPPVVASIVQPAEFDALHRRLKELPEPRIRGWLPKEDWLAALGVFFLVFLSTFPVVIPFTFMKDITLALRVSNGVAIAMLFMSGYTFGRITGRNPLWVGIVMVVFGAILVSATIALGG
jgi:VIT1/CCC1 family predicted Fe2+/Mn2+ transporter